MRTLTRLGYLLAFAALVGACTASPAGSTSSPELGFGPAPWRNGTTASYRWLGVDQQLLGTSEVAYGLAQNTWTITETDVFTGVEQTAAVRLSAVTLAPLAETKTITTATDTVHLETQYQDGKVAITAEVNGKTQTASLDVPANALDNDQLLVTLSALPFANGYTNTYTVIVTQNALKVDTTVTVGAQETITVPAGSFETWRVDLEAARSSQTAWYEVAAPHTLIKYDNGTNNMVLTKP